MQTVSAFETSLLREPAYQMFLNTLRSEETAKIYRYLLLKYMRFHNFKSTNAMLRRNTKLIETDIIQYLTENPASKPTMRLYMASIRHFYNINDITLNWYKLKRYRAGEYVRRDDRAYTAQEIQTLLNIGDVRDRAVILLLASTGMRVGGVAGLKIRHLLPIKEYGLYQITVYARTKDEYITFCTPECAAAIDQYLEYRKRAGELIKPDAPVIREQFDKNDELQAQQPQPATVVTIKKLVKRLLLDSGLRTITKLTEGQKAAAVRHEVAALHGFRKFFNTTMKITEIKPLFIETYLGHKTGLDSHYFRPTERDLLREYVKGIDALTIDPTKRLAAKVTELEQKAKKADQIEHLEKIVVDGKMESQAILKRLQEQENRNKRLEERQTVINDLFSDPAKLKRFLEGI